MAKLAVVAIASVLAISAHGLDIDEYHHYGHCPHGDNWHSLDYSCYQESHDRLSFREAVRWCLTDDLSNGPYNQLMPVGKLRNFINRYTPDTDLANDYDDFRDHHHHYFHDRYGPFRVNAIKGSDHVWREYPSGYEVPFHHFPDFDPSWGHEGDTLIWHPASDELRVVDDRNEYTALCHRPKHGVCHRCGGWQRGDHECNDAGYCVDGECHCDMHFSGVYCENEPAPRRQVLFVVGGDRDDQTAEFDQSGVNATSMIYDFETDMACIGPDLPYAPRESIGGYTHGQAIICGGLDARDYNDRPYKNCWALDKHTQAWSPIQTLERNMHLGDTINFHNGEDMWVIGADESTQTWVYNHRGYWEDGPFLPRPRYGGCVAQISDCEFAVIGGQSSEKQRDEVDVIDIYNIETDTWRCAEVTLPSIDHEIDCETVEDFMTGNPIVIIVGTDESDGILHWDVVAETFTTVPGPDTDGGSDDGEQIVRTGRYNAVIVGGDHSDYRGRVYRYGLDTGPELLPTLLPARAEYTVSMMVPRDYVRCRDDPSLPQLNWD